MAIPCLDASLETLQPLCCCRMYWLQGISVVVHLQFGNMLAIIVLEKNGLKINTCNFFGTLPVLC